RSLATWSPTSGVVARAHRTEPFVRWFRSAADDAYLELQRLVGRGYGVDWIDSYVLRTTAWQPRPRVLAPVLLPRLLSPEEHDFVGFDFVGVRPTLRIEPAAYLDALLRDVLVAGVEVRVRRLASRDDVLGLPQTTVVNCLGLAGGAMFGDDSVTPVKGQLVRLVPQPEVTYGLSAIETDAGDFFYMAPRSDGIVLGGSAVRGDATLDVDDALTRTILGVHAAVMA
ncbi:MAG: FAD-dependent oxidoreductase, partial [Myxococcota bacterium]